VGLRNASCVFNFSGFAKIPALAYLGASFEFCLSTRSTTVPSGPDWYHEIKYDGFCLRVERNGDRVRLITRGGYDWTRRYPWIVEAALKNRTKHFVIDGEAVIFGVDGYSDFNAMHSTFRVLAVDLFFVWRICMCSEMTKQP